MDGLNKIEKKLVSDNLDTIINIEDGYLKETAYYALVDYKQTLLTCEMYEKLADFKEIEEKYDTHIQIEFMGELI